MTLTLPGTQIRDLSFLSTSVHIVSSDSSLAEREQVPDVRGVGKRVRAARHGAGDGAGLHPVAGDADVHFW